MKKKSIAMVTILVILASIGVYVVSFNKVEPAVQETSPEVTQAETIREETQIATEETAEEQTTGTPIGVNTASEAAIGKAGNSQKRTDYTNQPVKKPAATEPPSTTEPPVTTDPPTTTEPPAATEPPQTTEPPPVTEPSPSEEPDVKETIPPAEFIPGQNETPLG